MIKSPQPEPIEHYAIISALWKDNVITSVPIPLRPNTNETKEIYKLAETGTDSFTKLKYPISDTEFVVFFKTQLNETLIFIKILDKNELEAMSKAIAGNKEKKPTRKKASV